MSYGQTIVPTKESLYKTWLEYSRPELFPQTGTVVPVTQPILVAPTPSPTQPITQVAPPPVVVTPTASEPVRNGKQATTAMQKNGGTAVSLVAQEAVAVDASEKAAGNAKPWVILALVAVGLMALSRR
ncbi:MAG: hypothetical protein ACRD0K_10130 [Egibacteraceae bacterium]